VVNNPFDQPTTDFSDHTPYTSAMDRLLSPGERLAILETRFDQISRDNNEIMKKLDELLQLKHKGLGAFWFVGIIISTGLVGLVTTMIGYFSKGHL
jgi:hypothetical protein